LTETREALEQQTATAEILRVISSSPADLQPTFDAIANAARMLTGAALGSVVTYDGGLMHVAALAGFTPEEIEKAHRVFPLPADPALATGRAILTRHAVQIEDLDAVPEHPYPTLVQASGRTVLAVPMLRDGIPIGAINVQRRLVEPFTDKQIDLIKTFADQAVIAMENARLITETREALEQQTATAEVLQVINSCRGDLAPVFDTILEKALRLCGAAHGHVFRVEGDLGRAVAARGEPEFVEWLLEQEPVRRPTPGGILHRMMQGERVVQIPDSTDTEGYRVGKAIRELIDRSGVRTTLGIALRNDSALLGALLSTVVRCGRFPIKRSPCWKTLPRRR
jgi:GAF domain-containing protein